MSGRPVPLHRRVLCVRRRAFEPVFGVGGHLDGGLAVEDGATATLTAEVGAATGQVPVPY
ncbi:hypothetical protein GCM10010195_50110 [Kitasatospora griseola]|nr:hypothetical protein GCM10010195_50110 [Kitasatospora griseola]